MTEHETIKMSATHHDLVLQGLAAGLSGTTILELIQEFGPVIAQLLIQILAQKGGGGVTPSPSPVPATLLPADLGMAKLLLAGLLTKLKPQILAFLDTNEAALLDLIIAKLSA